MIVMSNRRVVSCMKNFIINNSLSLIKKYYPDYTKEKITEIEYGLVGLYLLISKSIIIFTIAYILGIFKELFIFTIIYNIVRAPSFGAHASKSWVCLIISSSLFISATYLCNSVTLPIWFKIVFGIIGIILIFIYSPADTAKRPIINPKRRIMYKLTSTIIAIIFVFLSLYVKNNFLANSFIIALLLQTFFISPLSYCILGQSYNNYKKFGLNNNLNIEI